ncbi:MAG TPA: ubiquinol-cytochrome c reductase iron-sulfur subunit [Gammaproteobacteria bacterium]|nr:ubiquinol-cytochrome c reductase iron-sulfur subunit [Gammaproteobacteria bacterium]
MSDSTLTAPGTPPSDKPDMTRRRMLVAAASVVGAAGIGTVIYPFVDSMEPSARAKAAGSPVEADISKLEPGQLVTVRWRSKPVWILRRTKAQLATLPKMTPRLKDPKSLEPQQIKAARNEHRSIKPEYYVCVGICTHLGCIPTYRPQVAPPDLGPDWLGGFFCPCHGSRYDLAGRVMDGSPAPLNLPVMPYYYVKDTVLRIGVLEDGSGLNWKPNTW